MGQSRDRTRTTHTTIGALRLFFVAALVCGTLASIPAPAAAQSVGLEIDLGVPVGDAADTFDLGWGGEVRAGYGAPVPLVTLEAEAAFDYYSFGITDVDESANIYRVVGGLRLGLGLPYVPSLFGHVGWGKVDMSLGGVDASSDGLSWDVGLASDLFSVPLVAVGLHLAFKRINTGEDAQGDSTSVDWLGIGLHGELGF
jgi:hypothetical protein